MERRTVDSYNRLLRIVRDSVLQQGVQVASVMTDYEIALRQSVIATFPNTQLRGCWFHYSKAVYMRSKLLFSAFVFLHINVVFFTR